MVGTVGKNWKLACPTEITSSWVNGSWILCQTKSLGCLTIGTHFNQHCKLKTTMSISKILVDHLRIWGHSRIWVNQGNDGKISNRSVPNMSRWERNNYSPILGMSSKRGIVGQPDKGLWPRIQSDNQENCKRFLLGIMGDNESKLHCVFTSSAH